ncbi:MAG: hypothetical protein ABH811_01150 [archaeon]
MNKKINLLFYLCFISGIFLLGFTLASVPTWFGSDVNYSLNEDTSYFHDLSKNITGFNNDVSFAIDTQSNINWTNASGVNSVSASVVEDWIKILNPLTGNLSINVTHDNQSGFFIIPIQATNLTDSEASVTNFEFIINTTNDAPSFSNIDREYNLTRGTNFLDYINATDEEEMYALFFNASFYTNCSLAIWSTRGNCSLFDLTNISNTSAILNYTPTKNDVGVYWANISVRDWGNQYPCPHVYCDNASYKVNKTTYEHVVMFNVFDSLSINASDCENKIFQENQSGACQINITTKLGSDSVNITSNGSLRNYAASVSNTTWFYAENFTDATNYLIQVFVNVTPQKTEIGNWTINFTAHDITFSESISELIYVWVNRTLNDVPDLIDISNLNTSIGLQTKINLTVYDDDLLIPDKSEGYNETITFDVEILNQSDLSQELSLSGFDVEILNMPVSGTNRTEARILFTPSTDEIGNYTINITINDSDGSIDSDLFNFSILSNNYPIWNQTEYLFNLIVNSSFANTTNFGPINLTNGYVDDIGDVLTFTNGSSAMPRFNLSSIGMISFTPYKQDVGSWNFTITATDSLGLQNTTIFRFNITNVNSNPVIESPLSVTNASVDANSNIDAQEDNYTIITLWIQDEDFKISSAKKDYYNESFTVNLTIEGNNTNLFYLVIDSSFPTEGNNRSKYSATFIPNRTDVGEYNITINVTDESGSLEVIEFNLTITGVNDKPYLTDLINQTAAVNRSFYYDINASDEEDGADSQGDLLFTYSFLSGIDFLNTTTFNSTSGEINLTFNSSQSGKYQINITVNDTSDSKDSQIFWIYVYGVPNITYPSSEETFNLQENITSNLTFRGNHSVQDNLTYEFYLNNFLKYNITYYGNDTNLTWEFTPNFTEETDGEFQNLTLVVYSTNSNLENITDLNYTLNWDVNITHSNAPVVFRSYIGDKQATYDQGIEINLSSYFSDVDNSDVDYNQSLSFTVVSDSNPSSISSSLSDWTLTLSSSSTTTEILNITVNDSSTNVTSNNFEVEFTAPSSSVTTTSSVGGGGGGGSTTFVSLKIIMPDPVSAYQKDKIVLPLTLYNNGKTTLSGISLTNSIAKNGILKDDISVSFDKSFIASLRSEQREDVIMTIETNTEENGTFEITINADVSSPSYSDWGKLYLTIKEGNTTFLEKLIFAQEFLQENPECIELEELLDEARAFFEEGDFINSVLKIQESIDGCKNAISQQARAKIKYPTEDKLYRYLLLSTIGVFFIGLGYYSYKRMKLKRASGDYFVRPKKSKVLTAGIFIILVIIPLSSFFLWKDKIQGFIINDVPYDNWQFGIFILFVGVIFGLFIFLKRIRTNKKFRSKKSVKILEKVDYQRRSNERGWR